MTRQVALALLGLFVVVSLACRGGDDDGGLIAVRRLDLEDMALTAENYVTPPASLLGTYPAVVAAVNAEPISGDALVAEQVRLELGRRNLVGDLGEQLPEELLRQQLQELDAGDALESLINDALKSRAAERLGFLPSYQEAAEYARQYEQYLKDALERGSPDERRQLEEGLRVSGQLKEGWSSDPHWVDSFRRQMGLAQLQDRYCSAAPTQDRLTLQSRRDCTDVLRRERQHADIVYFVRWSD